MYKEIISPILDRLDSETMHVLAREGLHFAEKVPQGLRILEFLLADKRQRFTDSRLQTTLGTVTFDNPLIVGAGWDKKGRAVEALHRLGFGGTELGTVPAWDQDGNKKPRQFMIAPGVALNRLGFNSPGMNTVDHNLEPYYGKGIPIGISVGKNKEVKPNEAPMVHAFVVRRLYRHASYFAINVSSPNTPGLRELQDKGPLTDIVQAVNQEMEDQGGRKDLYVKIAPDLTNEAIDDVIQVALENGLTGIIVANTTIRPDLKLKYGAQWTGEMGMGGLSGDDVEYRSMVNEKIAYIYNKAGPKLVIIGVGGVKDATTALGKIMAGAQAVQVVTAIRGEGPSMPGRTTRGLIEYMDRNGISTLTELVGVRAREYQ